MKNESKVLDGKTFEKAQNELRAIKEKHDLTWAQIEKGSGVAAATIKRLYEGKDNNDIGVRNSLDRIGAWVKRQGY